MVLTKISEKWKGAKLIGTLEFNTEVKICFYLDGKLKTNFNLTLITT